MNTEAANGWFKATRSSEALELIAANPNAFVLSYLIASRAQWSERFNRHGLQPGEAFLGDHASYGMSEREYRTAKSQLEKWGFATFRTTNKGTVAKLTDTRLFDVLQSSSDGQNDTPETDIRQASDRQATTTKNIRREEQKKQNAGAPAPLVPGHLCVPVFLQSWEEWLSFRKKLKRSGDWNLTFQKHLDLLGKYDPATAAEMIQAAIRSSYPSPYPPKQNDTHTRPQNPSAQRNAFIGTTPAQEAATQARIRELQAASGQPGLAAQNAVF